METEAQIQLLEIQCKALDSITRAIAACCGAGCAADELVTNARTIGASIAANLANLPSSS